MPRSLRVAMAASGSGSTPRIRPRRNGFFPEFEGTSGADWLFGVAMGGRFASTSSLIKTAPECCKNSRRLGRMMTVLFLLDGDVLPAHLYAAAGVNLQTDDAFAELWGRIGKINDLGSVDLGHDVVAVHRDLQIVPLAGLYSFFAGFGGHGDPTTAAALIESPGMFADAWVNLYLHAFNVGAVLGVVAGDFGADK